MEEQSIKAVYDKETPGYHRYKIQGGSIIGSIYLPKGTDWLPGKLVIELHHTDQKGGIEEV